MQGRMSAREKNSNLPPAVAFAPLGQGLMETFGEGIVVFDPYGRMLYANQRARRVIEGLGDGAAHRGDHLRERLMAFGGRARALKQASMELGEAVFLPEGDNGHTLAERERQAILDTLEVTHGKLAETARRLGVTRHPLGGRVGASGWGPNGAGTGLGC